MRQARYDLVYISGFNHFPSFLQNIMVICWLLKWCPAFEGPWTLPGNCLRVGACANVPYNVCITSTSYWVPPFWKPACQHPHLKQPLQVIYLLFQVSRLCIEVFIHMILFWRGFLVVCLNDTLFIQSFFFFCHLFEFCLVCSILHLSGAFLSSLPHESSQMVHYSAHWLSDY